MATIVQLENIYKEYQLGVFGHGTLYRDLQSCWASIRGREDPNSIIGHRGSILRNNHILALNNINLELKEGEVLGIIGANGAGKSTLLKVLSRITAPTKGLVKVRGRIASLLEVGTGFHPELTGRENIYLNGAINGMKRMEVKRKLDEIVDFAGVGEFLDTPVKRYSSGMHVRLGFAVAAHLEPDILLVDEVLAVGDAEFQKKAIGKMGEVSAKYGRTVLFVSHNMQTIASLCPDSILMKNGSVVSKGNSSELILRYYESIRNSDFDETTGINNRNVRRGDGKTRFTSIKVKDATGIDRQNFVVGEKIQIHFSFKVFSLVKNLTFKIALRSERTNEYIFNSVHLLSKDLLKPGYLGEAAIEIDTNNLQSNSFNLYFWLGIPGVKGQCDVVEGLSLPLLITDSECNNDGGYVKLQASLVKNSTIKK